jgi:ATP-binding cassette subfamily F protein uup
MEGGGQATVYAGGWSDYQAQKGSIAKQEILDKPKAKLQQLKSSKSKQSGLSFTEKHRLEELPSVISQTEAEIAKLEELLSDAKLFTQEPVKFKKATTALAERQAKLAASEEEWMMLEEKAG